MNKRFPVSARFKGQRDYLQGGDLYDAACAILETNGYSDLRKIDVAFHKILREGLDLEVLECPVANAPTDAAAVFQFASADQSYAAYLIPNGQPVTNRDPYHEEQIVEACEFDLPQQQVTVSKPLPFSNIEILVAMNKALLQRLFPDSGGKWYFTRLQLSGTVWNRTFAAMQVRLEANLNFLVTRSAIVADGKPIGRIFFSLVK